MTSVALPRAMVAPPRINGDDKLASKNVILYPANASGNSEFAPNSNSRIVFNIPAYANSFVNPKRSYLSFKVTKSGGAAGSSRLVDGVPFIDRLTVRAGTQVVEDIMDYPVLERAMALMEGVDYTEGRATMNGDFGDIIRKLGRASKATTDATHVAGSVAEGLMAAQITKQEAGTTFTKPLLSGVIGKGQEYYVPVGLFENAGSFAMQLEIYLAKAQHVVKLVTGSAATPTYTLSNVRLHLEVVTLPERALNAFNGSIARGGMISLPFNTYRVHKHYVQSSQSSIDMSITESAQNVERVIVAMRPQAAIDAYNTVGHLSDDDNFNFVGGANSGSVVSKWQFRYGQSYYPPATVENDAGSLPTVLASLASMDLLGKSARLTSLSDDGIPLYEEKAFLIAQGFKTSPDDILNGLNASSTGAPIQLFITWASTASVNIALDAFVESSYNLNIKQGGQVTLVDGSIEVA